MEVEQSFSLFRRGVRGSDTGNIQRRDECRDEFHRKVRCSLDATTLCPKKRTSAPFRAVNTRIKTRIAVPVVQYIVKLCKFARVKLRDNEKKKRLRINRTFGANLAIFRVAQMQMRFGMESH